MKVSLEINRKKPGLPSKKFLEEVVFSAVKYSKYPFSGPKELTVSLASVSREEIRKINKKYRGRNAVTDILSVPNYENRENLLKEKKAAVFLGELIICCDYVRKSAKLNNVSFKKEIICVIAHGILHLLGFNHTKEMFLIQNKAVDAVIKKAKK